MVPTGTPTERAFAERMEAEGWQVYKNGFPDFLCIKNGEAILVEVKATNKQKVSEHQQKMMGLLTAYSFKGFRWSPDIGQLIPFAAAPLKRLKKEKVRVKIEKPIVHIKMVDRGRGIENKELNQRIRELWATGRYRSYSSLARMLHIQPKIVERAIKKAKE